MGIRDGRVDLDGGSVEVTGITRLLKDAEAVGIAVEDLKDLTYRLGQPIATLAASLAPRKSGRLAGAIKPSKSKRKVMVRVGSKSLPYAAPQHWGYDSRSGEKWLSRAEETLRPHTFAGFGLGIKQLLDKHDW